MKASTEAQRLYEEGMRYYYNNKYEEALRFLNESLRIEPNFAEIRSYLANVHRFLGYRQKSKEI